MFTLKILVMGLIGLVQVGDGVVFVLPSATHAYMRHVPVLVCDHERTICSATSKNQWPQIKRALNIGVNDAPMAFLLDGERLELVGVPAGRLERPRAVRHGILARVMGACPRNKDEASSLSWVPNLRKIEPRAAFIDPVHLTNPDKSKVAALLPLFVKGKLQSLRYPTVEDNGKYFAHSLTFKSPGTTSAMARKHAAPDVLEVEMEVEREAVIRLLPFNAAEDARKLTIKPSGDKPAVVLLGNLTPLQEPVPQKVGDEASHFKLYYGLSIRQNSSDRRALRIPHIGQRRVEGDYSKYDLPRVLETVSKLRPEISGSERPICTSVVYTLP